jgi:protein-tyrosine phosphatase
MNRLLFNISVLVIFLAFVIISCTTEQREETEKNNVRHIQLEGQSNFRDIGGYRTIDGKTVKWGEIYRSGLLSKLTDNDLKIIDSLRLKTVVNFLTDFEVESKGKDKLPSYVSEQPLPIENDPQILQLTREVESARKTGDFSRVPVEINRDLHKILTRAARKEYAELYRKIINPNNRPIAYHCSHGIHRTGTATAILLYALGVPWEKVREDYLLSNKYRKDEIGKRVMQLTAMDAANKGISVDELDNTNIRAFYILDGSYIDGVKEVIEEEYGSVRNYFSKGLGISDEEMSKLKMELLTE